MSKHIAKRQRTAMEMEADTNLIVMKQTPQIVGLHTIIRNRETSREQFIFYSDRLIRLLIEEGLNHLPYIREVVTTPTGDTFSGLAFGCKICGVSIVRAGESMEAGLREVCQSIRIGKILIQRNEDTAMPKLFYSKLPEDISNRKVLLLDPMLATGGSSACAIQVLKDHGVAERDIIFLNLIAAPEGIYRIRREFPNVKIITTMIDRCLDNRKFILPGVGDFGDLYFGT